MGGRDVDRSATRRRSAVLGCALLPFASQALGKVIKAARPPDNEALGNFAFHRDQHVEVFTAFDTFGHDRPAKRMG